MKYIKSFEAIKIKEKKESKKKRVPYYTIKYNYMIGDADGDTSEKIRVSVDNPYIERYCKLLNSLKPIKGRWGVVLEEDRLESCLSEGQITQDDFDFLKKLMFEENTDENDKFSMEFCEGVRSNSEYSFLVFQGIDLVYVDEDGRKHKTYFE